MTTLHMINAGDTAEGDSQEATNAAVSPGWRLAIATWSGSGCCLAPVESASARIGVRVNDSINEGSVGAHSSGSCPGLRCPAGRTSRHLRSIAPSRSQSFPGDCAQSVLSTPFSSSSSQPTHIRCMACSITVSSHGNRLFPVGIISVLAGHVCRADGRSHK
jgi:hypothetical protein